MDITSSCINGELKPGDLVISIPEEDYSCLVGTVLSINMVGTPEHDSETENETDSIHVDFFIEEYSDKRVKEIESMFSELFNGPRTIDEIALDDVIMSPDMLINITGTSREDLDFILDSEENATSFCRRFLTEHNISDLGQPLRLDNDAAVQNLGEGFNGSAADSIMTEGHLYSPLQFYLHNPREEEENGEYGLYDLYDERYEIPNYQACEYTDAIELALRRDRDSMDKTHGMAVYLPDELREKIWAMFPSIEFHGDGLYCVTKMELSGALTPDDMASLKDWWTGQLSDGWGESLEQHGIKDGREELYIVPWTHDDNKFFIETQVEFNWRIGAVPPVINDNKALAGFIASGEPIMEYTSNHGFMENAVNGLIAYASEVAAKSVNDWPALVSDARKMALNIAQYGDLLTPNQYASIDWTDVFNDAVGKARNSPSDIINKSMDANEYGIRGLAWFACEMADRNDDGLQTCITEVRGMMSRMANFWGFDQSLCDSLNAIIDSAIDTSVLPDPSGTGYFFAVKDDGDVYIPNAMHIERDEIMMKYASDQEAAVAAKHDGVPLINGIAGVPDDMYIDTPGNRGIIEKWVKQEIIESPAQAALWEPDAADDPGVAKLRLELIDRLSENLSDFFDTLRGFDGEEIADMSLEIAAMTGAHFNLTELYNFHKSELEYLLKFQNPLKVVADEFEWEAAADNRSDVMWKVFHEQNALKGDYTLISEASAIPDKRSLSPETQDVLLTQIAKRYCHFETLETRKSDSLDFHEVSVWGLKAALEEAFNAGKAHQKTQANYTGRFNTEHDANQPSFEKLEQQLRERLSDNYNVFKRDMLDLSKDGLFHAAAEIVSVQEAYAYFTQDHIFIETDVDFLLKFENPLELISDVWSSGPAEVTAKVDAIFNNQGQTLQNGSYTLVSDEPESAAAVKEPQHKAVDVNDKTSVLDRIKQRAHEQKEHPAATRNKGNRKESETEH